MKTYWYLTRASGTVSLILLTVAIVIGILAVGRVQSPRWPRFVIDGVHRSSSLLAVVFLAIHIVTAVLDSFAPISLLDAVVPFAGSYRPIWLGLGAAAFDLLLAVDDHQPAAPTARAPVVAIGALAGLRRVADRRRARAGDRQRRAARRGCS